MFGIIKHSIILIILLKNTMAIKKGKYIYVVFDFPISKKNYKIKQRKIGNNQNIYWKTPVKVFSRQRRMKFINE